MRSGLCILLLILIAIQAQAQDHDTLAPAEVRSQRLNGGDVRDRFTPGVKVQGIDSITMLPYRADNLSVLLAGATTAAVKSYGFNSFATVSFRGASAAQSAVYWEGIPLMNGATGITDVSLLPVSLIDSISLNYGSSSALLGSGNVGGAVMLHDPRPSFTTRRQISADISASVGSFGQYNGSYILRYAGRHFFLSGGMSGLWAGNDFHTTDEKGDRVLIDHAEQHQLGYRIMGGWRMSIRSLLSAHFWRQSYDRQIPRALFESYSAKEQHDEDTRFLMKWEHVSSTARIYAKAAYMKSSYEYSDSVIHLRAGLGTNHVYAEAGGTGYTGRNGQVLVFVPFQYFYLDGPLSHRGETRIAIAGAYTHRLLKDRLSIGANFRLESFDGDIIALPGLNASYQFRQSLRLRVNAQRTYRAPTLNELYYEPGGNSSLKPEQGWSVDGGYDYKYKRSEGLTLTHSLSAYNRHIDDWIIWLGGSIWTPHNLAGVHSRGLETENTLSGNWRHVNWRLGLNAAYTRSTTTRSYLSGDNSIGCQIPYVPELTTTGIAGLGWQRFYFELNTTYTGKRYITSDESASLPGYVLGNARIRYAASVKHIPFILQGIVNNVFNARYEVVGFRPMPGINYRISLSLSLRTD